MITKITIKSQSNSFSIKNGIITFVSDSSVDIKADSEQNALYLGLGDFLPSAANSQYGIKTINQLSAASWDNNFYILGSGCTSIITPKTTSDSLEIWSDSSTSAVIGIFDGCVPCRNCDTIAQLQRSLEQCQIWINGLKDCNLYYDDTASQLWESMKNKVVQQSDACVVTFSDQILNRKQSLKRATKLLYQYKALVALWNYLVRTKQGFMHTQTAPQDWAGFIVGSKRVITNCGQDASDSREVTLNLRLTLQSGQNITYLQTRMLESDSAPQKINYYVGTASQNTYIQYGGDRGQGQKRQEKIGIGFSESLWYSQEAASDSQIQISAKFIYHIHKGSDITLSGAVKVLPSISFRNNSSDSIASLVSLSDWAQLRGGTKQLQTGSDIAQNIWCIQSWWDFDTEISDSKMFYQERYFKTPYSKIGYPAQSDALS